MSVTISDYTALKKQNELLKEHIRQLEKKSIDIVRCKDCVWYGRSRLKEDGTPDMRYKSDFCDLHDILVDDDYYCASGERKEVG